MIAAINIILTDTVITIKTYKNLYTPSPLPRPRPDRRRPEKTIRGARRSLESIRPGAVPNRSIWEFKWK